MPQLEYKISELGISQRVLVEPVEFPEEGEVYKVESIGLEVTLSGPGNGRLSVDIESLMRDGTDANGCLRFTPLLGTEVDSNR